MRRAWFAVLFFAMWGCAREPASRPRHSSGTSRHEYADRYAAWAAGIQGQLAAGRGWVFGDEGLRKYLAEHAPLHQDLLLDKLKSNMFVVEILDESNTLADRYGIPPAKGTIAMNDRQALWLRALRSGVGDR